jgi:hypothetical protein
MSTTAEQKQQLVKLLAQLPEANLYIAGFKTSYEAATKEEPSVVEIIDFLNEKVEEEKSFNFFLLINISFSLFS